MEFTGERVIPGEVDPDLWNEHLSRYVFAARFAQLRLSDRGVAPDARLQSTTVSGAAAASADPASAVFRVLDAGCGSGYGTAHLAGLDPALQVVGMDHSEEALAYARGHYAGPNLRFTHGDCLALEFADGEFDLVVAFEVLEHLTEPASFLQEARRVLRPSGHLLVSTPNRHYYSEERGYVNPFHTREYDVSEFDSLLEGFFPERVIFAQNHAPAIAFSPCGGTLPCSAEDGSGAASRFGAPPGATDQPHFLVAACDWQPGTVPEPFVFVPSAGNVLRERELHLHKLEEDSRRELEERERLAGIVQELKADLESKIAWARSLEADVDQAREALTGLQREFEERTAWALKLDAELEERTAWARSLEADVDQAREALTGLQREFEERTAWALKLDAELEERTAWARSLEADVDQAREALTGLQREFKERTAWALKLDAELEERTAWALKLDADLRFLLGSRWYRMGKKLRLSPVPPSDQGRGGGT